MTLKARLDALEALQAASKPSQPVLIVRESLETEAQARERYTALHGHTPPAGTPVITVVLCEIGN